MTRGLTAGQQSAAVAPHSCAVQLVEAIFDSGTVYGSLCGVDLPVGSVTYTALNKLRAVEPFSESMESTEGMRMLFDGVDAGIIAIAAAEPYRGRPLNFYEVWLDSSGAAIGSPVLIFPGLMTALSISEEGGQAQVVLEAEHLEAELRRPREIRYNDADQRLFFSNDKGFEWAEQTTELTLVWPSKEAFKK